MDQKRIFLFILISFIIHIAPFISIPNLKTNQKNQESVEVSILPSTNKENEKAQPPQSSEKGKFSTKDFNKKPIRVIEETGDIQDQSFRYYYGIGVQTLSFTSINFEGSVIAGMEISPIKGFPADVAGLKDHDLIILVDDQPMESIYDLKVFKKPTTVKLTIIRENLKIDFNVDVKKIAFN